MLAERTEAPVVPIFIRRTPDGTHRVAVMPALEFEDADEGEDAILHNTQRYTSIIEDCFVRDSLNAVRRVENLMGQRIDRVGGGTRA